MAQQLHKLTKFQVARSQLNTAIELWFNDKDIVSVHSLAYAAYEIIHVVSKYRKRNIELLFDSIAVKDEYRSDFNIALKKHANFFKHANKDFDADIEFNPELSRGFILFSILGIEGSGERLNDIEAAFMWWLYINKPNLLTDQGQKFLDNTIPSYGIPQLQELSKRDFLHIYLSLREDLKKQSLGQ